MLVSFNIKYAKFMCNYSFYNEKSFLEESLKRVLDNDIYDQIILSDDCSNDGSELIAEGFSDKYEKILYIKSNENQGKVML